MESETDEQISAKTERRMMRGPIAENSENNSATPPTKPSGENGEMNGTPPEMNCEDGEECTPPEMNCDDEENCEVPEMPDGMEGMGPMGDGGFRGQEGMQTADNSWHPAAYLAMGAGSVVLSLVIVYACFSKCFHLKPGAVFTKWQKFMWYCIATVVLAAGLSVLCYFIPVWTS